MCRLASSDSSVAPSTETTLLSLVLVADALTATGRAVRRRLARLCKSKYVRGRQLRQPFPTTFLFLRVTPLLGQPALPSLSTPRKETLLDSLTCFGNWPSSRCWLA